MNKKTRSITLAAALTATTMVTLYFATISPTGQVGIIAFASLFAAAAVIEGGIGAGIFVYVGSSIIGALILPNKQLLLLYIMFFGYYPVVKSIIEQLKAAVFEWIIKLVVFNISLAVTWFLLRSIIFGSMDIKLHTALIFLGGNVVFAAFDIGFSKLIEFYSARISKNINRR